MRCDYEHYSFHLIFLSKLKYARKRDKIMQNRNFTWISYCYLLAFLELCASDYQNVSPQGLEP